MYKYLQIGVALVFALGASTGSARDFHAAPLDFLFGNHIDTHQETALTAHGELFGYFYIIFTGETDPASGLPIARHPRGLSQDHDERCGISVDCKIGWIMRGQPGEAKFVYHSGVNGDDHPVWLVNRVDIPQPGHYSHFHWITRTATELRASDVPAECDKNNAGQLETQEPVATNVTCPGWFLKITAVRSFAFEHGGEIIPVRRGSDNATHLNLVTNYAVVEGITATRGDSH